MIQRIQTIFLILAAFVNPVVLFLPLGAASTHESMEDASAELTGSSISLSQFDEESMSWADKTLSFSDNTMLMVHTVLVVLVSLYFIVLIFLYQDRNRQSRLAYVGIVLVMAQIVVAALLVMQLPGLVNGENVEADPAFGLLLPIATLFFAYLAIRRIQKDERMVRDMNRIR